MVFIYIFTSLKGLVFITIRVVTDVVITAKGPPEHRLGFTGARIGIGFRYNII
jgi:hypothetical protein